MSNYSYRNRQNGSDRKPSARFPTLLKLVVYRRIDISATLEILVRGNAEYRNVGAGECNCRKVLRMFKGEKANERGRETRRRNGLFYEVSRGKGMSLLIDFPFSDFCLLVLEADAAFEPLSF